MLAVNAQEQQVRHVLRSVEPWGSDGHSNSWDKPTAARAPAGPMPPATLLSFPLGSLHTIAQYYKVLILYKE